MLKDRNYTWCYYSDDIDTPFFDLFSFLLTTQKIELKVSMLYTALWHHFPLGIIFSPDIYIPQHQ